MDSVANHNIGGKAEIIWVPAPKFCQNQSNLVQFCSIIIPYGFVWSLGTPKLDGLSSCWLHKTQNNKFGGVPHSQPHHRFHRYGLVVMMRSVGVGTRPRKATHILNQTTFILSEDSLISGELGAAGLEVEGCWQRFREMWTRGDTRVGHLLGTIYTTQSNSGYFGKFKMMVYGLWFSTHIIPQQLVVHPQPLGTLDVSPLESPRQLTT